MPSRKPSNAERITKARALRGREVVIIKVFAQAETATPTSWTSAPSV